LISLAPDGIRDSARQCEAPHFGFNITPVGAGSDLEALLSGMQILRYYSVEPFYREEIRRYVGACQTRTRRVRQRIRRNRPAY
jgi:hypothetical protein